MATSPLFFHLFKMAPLRRILLLVLGMAILLPLYEIFAVYPDFITLLVRSVENEALRTGRHLSSTLLQNVDEEEVVPDSVTPQFIEEAHKAISDYQLGKLKLFAPSGEVLYSTAAEEIGEVNQHSYFRDLVRAGKPYTKVVSQRQQSPEGKVSLVDMVETLIPILKNDQFIGAFEIHYDITVRKQEMERVLSRTTKIISLLVVVLSGAIFLALLQAVRENLLRDQAQHALTESEGMLRTITASSPEGILMSDSHGNIVYWNQGAERLFGYRAEEMVGGALQERLVPPRLRSLFQKEVEHIRKTCSSSPAGRLIESVALRKDGGEIPVEFSVAATKMQESCHFIVIVRDISVRKLTEQRLKLSAQVMEHALDGIVITDQQAAIQVVNPAFTQLTGYAAEEVIGRNPNLLHSGRHDANFYREMWNALLNNGSWQGEVWNRRKDGAIYLEWLSISAIHGEEGTVTHYIAIFTDISQRKQLEEHLAHLAYYDALTGLPNRTLFHDRLRHALSEVRRSRRNLAVLFLDLDGFKQINDQYGHRCGDVLLQEVAKRIQAHVREEDTLARLGGDEFALIINRLTSGEIATQVAQKIIDALHEPFQMEEGNVSCTVGVSIGISLFPLNGEDADGLLKLADKAMYTAKAAGKGIYRFASGGEGIITE